MARAGACLGEAGAGGVVGVEVPHGSHLHHAHPRRRRRGDGGGSHGAADDRDAGPQGGGGGGGDRERCREGGQGHARWGKKTVRSEPPGYTRPGARSGAGLGLVHVGIIRTVGPELTVLSPAVGFHNPLAAYQPRPDLAKWAVGAGTIGHSPFRPGY